MRRLGWLLPLVLLLALLPSAASADVEETEYRLKAIGIDDEDRARIHEAIERGSTWLLKYQKKDGGWHGSIGPPMDADSNERAGSDPGMTALAALALRHVGTPAAKNGVRRARIYLFDTVGNRNEILRKTYHAGLAAMLIMADGDQDGLAKDLARRLSQSVTTYGWWGYSTSSRGAGPPVNISTAQFGALGLWAAARAGARVPNYAYQRLAEGHVKLQDDAGGWRYNSTDHTLPRYHSYPQGTFMGLANLILGAEGLGSDVKPALERKIEAARKAGMAALVRDGTLFLENFSESTQPHRAPFTCPYYSIYALEKACLFAGVEKLGDMPWYLTGARALLALQKEDGSWQTLRDSTTMNTSFALLFLLRASAVYRPVTPRPVDSKPEGPVTPAATDE